MLYSLVGGAGILVMIWCLFFLVMAVLIALDEDEEEKDGVLRQKRSVGT